MARAKYQVLVLPYKKQGDKILYSKSMEKNRGENEAHCIADLRCVRAPSF